MSKGLPSITFLRECFQYDADTGRLVWKHRPRKHFNSARAANGFEARFAGNDAGRISARGYRVVGILWNGTKHYLKVHRVIWAIATGKWPDELIDHINMNRLDNRLENLRQATHSQNQMNGEYRKRNKLGVKGVTTRNGKFYASISIARKVKHLGTFQSIQAASAAYNAAATKYYGAFARLSKVEISNV